MIKRIFTILLACLATTLFLTVLPDNGFSLQAQDKERSPEDEKDLARIRKVADEILQKISDTSGLPITGEIKIDMVNKKQVREFLIETMDKEYPGDSLERQFEAYSYLGLVPADLDIRTLMADLITEQAGAFYNPENDTFYAISDLPPMFDNPLIEKTIIAHELTHALQDMSIDLFGLQQSLSDKTDELYGLMASMEGMATVVMSVGVMPVDIRKLPDLGQQTRMQMEMMTNMPEMKVFNSAPLYLRETLISPYAEGASFMQQYMKQYPEKSVGSLVKNLPVSSEQVLHFEKYAQNDSPSSAPLDELLGYYVKSGWNLIYTGPLGEFDLRVMMQLNEMDDQADSIAAGWDAFSFAALTKDNVKLLVGSSVWDTEVDAEEFGKAFLPVLVSTWGEGNVSVFISEKTVTFIASNDTSMIKQDVLAALATATNYIE